MATKSKESIKNQKPSLAAKARKKIEKIFLTADDDALIDKLAKKYTQKLILQAYPGSSIMTRDTDDKSVLKLKIPFTYARYRIFDGFLEDSFTVIVSMRASGRWTMTPSDIRRVTRPKGHRVIRKKMRYQSVRAWTRSIKMLLKQKRVFLYEMSWKLIDGLVKKYKEPM